MKKIFLIVLFLSMCVALNQSDYAEAKDSDNPPFGLPLTGIFQIPSGANSSITNNRVVTVTKAEQSQKGAIFSTPRFRLDLRKNSVSEMYMKIDGEADGLAFVMHNDPGQTTNYTGVSGSGLGVYAGKIYGYPQGQIRKSFAIEFDTYFNGSEHDFGLNRNNDWGHVAYSFPDSPSTYTDFGGNVRGQKHYGLQYPAFRLGEGKWRLLRVKWEAFDANGTGTLTYQLEGLAPVVAKVPRTTFDTDTVFWGFTASTGQKTESALVSFASVPGLIYYNDDLTVLDSENQEVVNGTVVGNDSEFTVKYSGDYLGGAQNLLNPKLNISLSVGQRYKKNSIKVNGESVTPVISGTTLQIPLSTLTLANSHVEVELTMKNTNFISGNKPKITTRIVADNYRQITGTTFYWTIDTDGPVATGKLKVINDNDKDSILGMLEYKELLETVKDNYSPIEDIQVQLNPDQNIDELVSKTGPKKLSLVLTDKVGNQRLMDVPIFVKNKEDLIVNDHSFLIKGRNINLLQSAYPKSQSELEKLVLTAGAVEIWEFDDLANAASRVATIDYSQLPKPASLPEVGEYPITVRNTQTSILLNLKMNILEKKTALTINFLNDQDQELNAPVILEGVAGTTINLAKEQQIQEIIQKILSERYQIIEKPKNEEEVPFKADNEKIIYRFSGTLSIKSFPGAFNFGRSVLTGRFIKKEQASFDDPLIIWDNRSQKNNWELSVRLLSELENTRDANATLANAIRYKKGIDDTIILKKGQSVPIANRRNEETSNEYHLSEEWKTQKTGFQLEVNPKEVPTDGLYKATILWELTAAP